MACEIDLMWMLLDLADEVNIGSGNGLVPELMMALVYVAIFRH